MHAGAYEILSFVTSTLCVTTFAKLCPDPVKEPKGLYFVGKFPEQPMTERQSTPFYLYCCVGNWQHVNITWSKFDSTSKKWQKAEFMKYRYTDEHGQILKFAVPDEDNDSGIYRCRASEDQLSINRTFDLQFVDCILHPSKIKFTSLNKTSVQMSVNQEFSMACEGEFGCKGALPNSTLAWWSYIDERGQMNNLSEGVSGHYRIQEFISRDETRKGAILTFTVAQEDFGRTFICSLHKDKLPPAGFNITLTKIDTDEQSCLLYALSALLVVPLIIAGILTRLFCYDFIVFMCASARDRLPEREPGQKYDAMVVPNDGTVEIAREFEKGLQQKGFRLYKPKPGESEMEQVDHVTECTTIFFIVSSCQENIQEFSMYIAICINCKINIVFIEVGTLTESEWKSLCKDYEKVSEQLPNLYSRAKWPENGSKLKQFNFWSKIKTSLPKPRAEVETDETASICPLVQTVNS